MAIFGVAVWSCVHFIPSIGQTLRSFLIGNFGEISYKIGFSVVVIASIILMVIGWRSTDPSAVYVSPAWTGPLATLLMIAAFLLFGASHNRTRIKRFIRHPQLTGMIIWALIEIPLINAREGSWEKPELPSMGVELKGHAISLAIFATGFFLHPYFAGVSPIQH